MNVPWLKILTVARRAATVALAGVQVSEQLAPQFGTPTGGDKLDSVLALVTTELRDASSATGVDLSSNAAVMGDLSALITAYVDLHNTMARELDAAQRTAKPGR